MRVGFLQLDVPRDARQTFDCLEQFLRRQPCELVVLPELSLCGYLFESRAQLCACAQPVPAGSFTQQMCALSQQYGCTLVFGLAERDADRVYNTAVVVSKGRYVGKYRKIHLSDFEKKLFDRGGENRVFEVDGLTLGVQICFDLWFPEMSREQLRQGADLFCVLANFGGEMSYHITRVRAAENAAPLVLCNRVGQESIPGMEAEFLGKSTAVDAAGNRIWTAPAGKPAFGVCRVEIPKGRSNVICSDLAREIAFHQTEHKQTGAG